MKVKIQQDEWWPVYIYSLVKEGEYVGSYEKVIEIPQDKIEWLNRVKEEFDKGQDYLMELFDKED